MGLAIADFLPDFAPPRPRVAPAVAQAPARTEQQRPLAAPPVDVDAIVAAAVAAAEADLGRRLETLYAERAAEDAARHADELAALRASLTVDLAAATAKALGELEQRLVDETTSTCARILSHVVDDSVRDRAIAALARAVRGAVGDVETVRLRVTGPQSMFLPFAAAMGEHARHLEFIESESSDITVSLDETLFETRLAEWSAALAEAVG